MNIRIITLSVLWLVNGLTAVSFAAGKNLQFTTSQQHFLNSKACSGYWKECIGNWKGDTSVHLYSRLSLLNAATVLTGQFSAQKISDHTRLVALDIFEVGYSDMLKKYPDTEVTKQQYLEFLTDFNFGDSYETDNDRHLNRTTSGSLQEYLELEADRRNGGPDCRTMVKIKYYKDGSQKLLLVDDLQEKVEKYVTWKKTKLVVNREQAFNEEEKEKERIQKEKEERENKEQEERRHAYYLATLGNRIRDLEQNETQGRSYIKVAEEHQMNEILTDMKVFLRNVCNSKFSYPCIPFAVPFRDASQRTPLGAVIGVGNSGYSKFLLTSGY